MHRAAQYSIFERKNMDYEELNEHKVAILQLIKYQISSIKYSRSKAK